MSHSATVLSIFVSSPSDVTADQEKIVSAISAWNQRNGASRGIFFNPLTWQQVVAPDRARSGQEVIDEQIGRTYDIYLGIMWSRFGSATQKADSGTEDEFNQAIDRHDAGEEITISFLFNGSPIPQDILDGDQYKKIQEFKRRVAEKGCLYREYSDDASLNEAINLILDRTANKASKVRGNPQGRIDAASLTREIATVSPVENDQDDLGLLDLNELMEEQANRFATLMAEWSAKLGGVGEIASTANDELASISRFGRIEPKATKRIVNQVAKYVEEVADWGEENQSDIEDVIEKFSDTYSKIITVSEDFNDTEEDIASAIESGIGLIASIAQTNSSLAELSQTALSMPRISKEMIRANKRLSAILERLVLKNKTFSKNVEIGVEELRARLKR